MDGAATACRPLVACRLLGLVALTLALAACGGGGGATLDTYDLQAANPGRAHALRAHVRVDEPFASLDLDSDRILVRTRSQQMAVLAGAKWPDRLPLVVRARLIQSFQNAGLAGQVGDNLAAPANYVLDLDIRKFELDVARSRVEINVAAKLVPTSLDVAAVEQIFTADAAVASTNPAAVAAAMDGALSSVMKRIVAFVATRL
jgi:phospholipid/cholesterol/gamma-HCH transport system substrate-binding protein